MRIAILGPVLLAAVAALALSAGQAPDAASQAGDKPAATKPPVHGLKAEFYSQAYPPERDEFEIPMPTKPPVATRIDSQIAFGRGKGFLQNIPAPWWEPKDWLSFAAVWKGYIRFPKAATYYLTTASADSSAVYLGGSRVALNGGFGGAIPSDAFSYGETAYGPTYHATRNAYVVPVTVDAPRVLPIEVRFLQHNLGGGIGIDLLWVTPDSPRDAQTGKPVAQLVPPEALYVEPPEPIAEPTTRGANCTISCDYLDLPIRMGRPIQQGYEATVTVRLADKDGRPVPGHSVHLASLVKTGLGWDVVVQPERPTDANGVTTAKVRPASRNPHESRLFAFDVTDVVQVAQVAHLRTVKALQQSFFPAAFGPYYDAKNTPVSPLPLRVGQPATITIPLTNRHDVPYEVGLRVRVRGWNIGAGNWKEIDESETFVLQPKETRDAKVVWIPGKEDGHVCFKFEVFGGRQKPKVGLGDWRLRPGELLALTTVGLQPPPSPPLESRQHNVGPVEGPPPSPEPTPPAPPKPGDELHGPPFYGGWFLFAWRRGSSGWERGERNRSTLHDSPSRDSRTTDVIPNGMRFRYTDVIPRTGEARWYYVDEPGGPRGWLSSDDVSHTRPTPIPPATPIPLPPEAKAVIDSRMPLTSAGRG